MIRFGIVGAGGIAEKFANDIQFSSGAVAVAIASRSLEKATTFKKKFNLEYAFGSYEEMAKSGVIDCVYIATPHSSHKQHSILFMNHKIHVLCEKPIAVNVSQFEEMVQSAKENNVLLMEAMWTKFLPTALKVRDVIQSGSLGKLKHAQLEFGMNMLPRLSEDGRLLNMDLAGGSLLDLGVYPVSYTLNITDQPIIKLDAKAEFHQTGVDINCIINMTFKDGSTAKLKSSMNEELQNSGVLEFEKGTITIDNFWRSERLTINDEEYMFPFIGGGFPYQINAFVETLKNGKLENDLMTHDQTRKSMQMLDDIRKIINLTYPIE